MAGFRISLDYHAPQGFWTAESSRGGQVLMRAGGLFTSAEAALAAMWLTVDERIELPAISTYAQVRELLDRRAGIPADHDAASLEATIISADVPDDAPADVPTVPIAERELVLTAEHELVNHE
jgi:hypothetical protein